MRASGNESAKVFIVARVIPLFLGVEVFSL